MGYKTTKTLDGGLTKRLHINQHALRRNIDAEEKEPVITSKTYKSNDYGHEVEIVHEGEVVARVVYADGRERKPLSCGARLWVETTEDVRVKIIE